MYICNWDLWKEILLEKNMNNIFKILLLFVVLHSANLLTKVLRDGRNNLYQTLKTRTINQQCKIDTQPLLHSIKQIPPHETVHVLYATRVVHARCRPSSMHWPLRKLWWLWCRWWWLLFGGGGRLGGLTRSASQKPIDTSWQRRSVVSCFPQAAAKFVVVLCAAEQMGGFKNRVEAFGVAREFRVVGVLKRVVFFPIKNHLNFASSQIQHKINIWDADDIQPCNA